MTVTEITYSILKLASVPLLVLLNAFFVAAEFALVKIRDTQLEELVKKGHGAAKVTRRIVRNLDAALSSTQLGITLASLGLGWVGKPVFAALLAPVLRAFDLDPGKADIIAFAVGFTVITFLHIVMGELAPKSLAIQKPLQTSLWVARPLQWFYSAFYPAIWLLNHAAFWLLRRCGIQPVSEAELIHSEEEIRLILGESRRHTRGPTMEQDIALNAFALRQRRASEIMRPRAEIVALNTEDTLSECLAVAKRTQYSRFPLCENGNLDKTLGVVHLKDLLDNRPDIKYGRDLAPLARKILFIPETARLGKLLSLFLQRKLHFAIVVDEYGGTVGMVTLENVLEELVGPIQDEFDEELPLARQVNGDTWEIDGMLPAHKMAEITGESIGTPGEATTASGLMTQRLGRFPCAGDTLAVGAWELSVDEAAETTAKRMRLTRHKLDQTAHHETLAA